MFKLDKFLPKETKPRNMKHILSMAAMAAVLLTACQPTPQTETISKEPSLILLNRNVLERVKHEIARGDMELMPAYKQLIAVADTMLTAEPLSVTMKKQTPPSGDMHDYVSRGPYWWPNPDTADGLPYIRKDGLHNPEYYEFTDRLYMERTTDMVSKLSLAFYLSGEEKYARQAANLLRVWFVNPETRMNPNLNYAQQIPGICDGRGIGIIDSRCIAKMLDYVILLQASPCWTEADKTAFAQWIDDFTNWLLTSENGKSEAKEHNNHGTWYDFQVTAQALFLDKKNIAKKQIAESTRSRMDSQLEADGEQPFELARTRPWNYSTFNLLAFVQQAKMGERVGVNLWEHVTPKGATLRKAIEWYFPFLEGEKDFVKEEITGIHGTAPLAEVLMQTSRFDTALYSSQLENLAKFANDDFDLSTSILSLTLPVIAGPILSDADFFDALNLDYPGLEAVRQAVSDGNYGKAKTEWTAYLRGRTNVKWYFDWHDFAKAESRNPEFDSTEADKVANRYITVCAIPHQFGEGIDWSLNPTPNKYCEWTWQLGRHRQWQDLREGYWATGDERYAQAWANELRSWIIQSPLIDFEGSVDYSHWRTIETGIRTLYAWSDAFFGFLPSKAFDDELMFWMSKSLYEHAIHIRRHHKKNNWFTMEMNGLFHICMLMPEFKQSATWADYAITKMYEDQQIQFYPDGAQVELTPHYHGVSVTNYFEMASIAQLNDYTIPADFLNGMEAAHQCYMNIYMPDGCMPSVNDSGWGDNSGLSEKAFKRKSEIYYARDSGNDDIRTYLGNIYKILPHRKDFLYVATQGAEGTYPTFTSTWMPWAGWYVMRSGWGPKDLYAFYEVGPYSAAHSHEDKLSLIIHAFGSRLLTEAGTYSYDTSDMRKYVLSGRAHNVSRVDGKDQNRAALQGNDLVKHSRQPMPNRWVATDEFDFGEGWYDEGFGAKNDSTVTQYRALAFIGKKYWLLIDVFTPTDMVEHEYQTWFHLNQTTAQTMQQPFGASTGNADAPNLSVLPLRADAPRMEIITGQTEPELIGWVSNKPCATPTFTRRQAGQCVEPYLLLPTPAGEALPVKAVEMENNTLRIDFEDGTTDVVTFTLEGNAIKTMQLNGKTVVE